MFKSRKVKKLRSEWEMASKRYHNYIVSDHRKDSNLAVRLRAEMQTARKNYVQAL